MVDEQHLEHALARLERLLGVHVHDLPFGHRRRARRRELGRLLDFHEAHAAHAGHRKPRVVAVVRNEHAGVLRRLEDRRARRHADRASFDRQVDACGVSAIRPTAGTERCARSCCVISASNSRAELLDARRRPAPRTSRSARRSSCRSCSRRCRAACRGPRTCRRRRRCARGSSSSTPCLRGTACTARSSRARRSARARAICFTQVLRVVEDDHAARAEHRAAARRSPRSP